MLKSIYGFVYEWEAFWENKEFLGFICSLTILILIGLACKIAEKYNWL